MQEWWSGALILTSQKSQSLKTPQAMGECVIPGVWGCEWDPGPGVTCLIAHEDYYRFHNRIQSNPYTYQTHSNEPWEPQSTWMYQNSASQSYHQGTDTIWESLTRLFSCRKVGTFPLRTFLHFHASFSWHACEKEMQLAFVKQSLQSYPSKSHSGVLEMATVIIQVGITSRDGLKCDRWPVINTCPRSRVVLSSLVLHHHLPPS